MKPLLGYACHVASVRLHGVAVRWTGVGFAEQRPRLLVFVTCSGCSGHGVETIRGDDGEPVPVECGDCGGSGENAEDITIADVAPRFAATIDALRDKWQHVAWVAGILCMGRTGGRR